MAGGGAGTKAAQLVIDKAVQTVLTGNIGPNAFAVLSAAGITIYTGVSGTVQPGQFLAIIGASGAGKTTLLNFLSGREISANLEKTGTIEINGQNQ